MQLLGLLFQLLEAAFGIDEDGIFSVFAEVEFCFELLRCLCKVSQ